MLPLAGIGIAGRLVIHHLGLDPRAPGGGFVAVVVIQHVMSGGVLAAMIRRSKRRDAITTGNVIHWSRIYDPLVAILTLGRDRALREVTIDRAAIVSGEAVLDVGCGTGSLTVRAKMRSGPTGRVVGIDPAPEMIAQAQSKAARAGLAIDYQVAAIEALPFPDATFDVVLSSLMMHHLPDDLKPRALAEVRRVLKPHGRLLVVDVGPRSAGHRILMMSSHSRHDGADEMRSLPPKLAAAGFVAIETGDVGFDGLGFVRAESAP